MQIRASIRVLGNTLTPDLQARLRRITGGGRAQLLQQIGLSIVSITKRTFRTDVGLRAAPWARKKDGTPSYLQDTMSLRNSIRIVRVDARGVVVGTDRPYGAIHQLGGTTPPHIIRPIRKKALKFGGKFVKRVNHPGSRIPARPYLPFYKDGTLTVRASRNVIGLINRAVVDPQ